MSLVFESVLEQGISTSQILRIIIKKKFARLKDKDNGYLCPVTGCRFTGGLRRDPLVNHLIDHSQLELENGRVPAEIQQSFIEKLFSPDQKQVYEIYENKRVQDKTQDIYGKMIDQLIKMEEDINSEGALMSIILWLQRNIHLKISRLRRQMRGDGIKFTNPQHIKLELVSIKRECKYIQLLLDVPPYYQEGNLKLFGAKHVYTSDQLRTSYDFVTLLWRNFKTLIHLSTLQPLNIDKLIGVKPDNGDVHLYARPFQKTLSHILCMQGLQEVIHLAMVGAFQGVPMSTRTELFIEISNRRMLALFMIKHLQPLQRAEQTQKINRIWERSHSNRYFTKAKKIDLSIDQGRSLLTWTIELSHHMGYIDFKRQVKSPAAVEDIASLYIGYSNTPSQLTKILKGTVLAHELYAPQNNSPKN